LTQHEIYFVIGSYLLGSIPVGYIIYFLTERKDIRKEGSGNIGATNVWRTKGKTAAVVTLALDMLKGIIPIVYGLRHFDSPVTVIMGGAAVILGHLFPIYIKFKGGKGIASMAGVFIVFHFPSIVVFALAFCLTLYITKYVSLSSIAGVTALFFCILFTQIAEVSTIVLVTAVLIIYKHRGNVRRVMAGTEDKSIWKA
jgi:glycerol-3-phosphate acyltransferase PlsY